MCRPGTPQPRHQMASCRANARPPPGPQQSSVYASRFSANAQLHAESHRHWRRDRRRRRDSQPWPKPPRSRLADICPATVNVRCGRDQFSSRSAFLHCAISSRSTTTFRVTAMSSDELLIMFKRPSVCRCRRCCSKEISVLGRPAETSDCTPSSAWSPDRQIPNTAILLLAIDHSAGGSR